MKQKQIYRSVFQLEVLSEEPIEDDENMGALYDQTINGDYSGKTTTILLNQTLKGMEAVKYTLEQGSDPEFFNMDKNGNEIEDN